MTALEASRCAAAASGPLVVPLVVSTALPTEVVKPDSETTSVHVVFMCVNLSCPACPAVLGVASELLKRVCFNVDCCLNSIGPAE
jgi:hypothetical protein